MHTQFTKVLAFSAFAALTTTASHGATLTSGFEQGPDVASISFSSTDTDGLGWFASNTDGERIKTAGTKPAGEGDFYASLLQNAGAYDGSALGVGDFGATGFDRIYANFSAFANTVYDVSFLHAADDRFGYLGDTMVVEIVDTDTNTTLALEEFISPGLFNWTSAGFTFNSGSSTSLAIAFAVFGDGNTSGVIDDVSISAAIAPIPIPAGGLLLGSALGFLAMRRKRKT